MARQSEPDRADPPAVGLFPGRSLRDELSSLKIDRKPARSARASSTATRPDRGPRQPRGGGGGGVRLLSILLWLIPIGLLAGAGYYGYDQYRKIRPKPKVTTARVRELSAGEAGAVLKAKGYLRSRFQAMIGAKAPGRVQEMLVEEGSKVKKGDLLAVLEHDDIQAQLASREAMVARSRAELAESQADLELKRLRAARAGRLRSLGQNSEEDREQSIADYRMSAAKVDALEAGIRLQESMVAEVRTTIQDMHIVAPFDGTIVEKAAEVGETITPGGMGAASGRGSVATLANLGELEVETDIAENLLGRVQIGQPAEIAVSAVPGRVYEGRLRRIVPMGDRARGTVQVYVEVIDPDDSLFPELVASVNFLPMPRSYGEAEAETREAGGLYAPASAIVVEGEAQSAWVVNDANHAHRRAVKVLIEDSRARIESGLKAGDLVILDPPADLRDDDPVTIDD